MKLIDFIAKLFPEYSKGQIKRLIEQGAVEIDKKVLKDRNTEIVIKEGE